MHSGLNCSFGSTYNPLSHAKKQLFDIVFKDLQVVIIDEMSMVSSTNLYDIHHRLHEIFQPLDLEVVFGGKAVVLLGDLMQLKPVRGSPIYAKPKGKGDHRESLWRSTSNLWAKPKVITLTRNFRQGQEDPYLDCLNQVRCLTDVEEFPEAYVNLLKSRRLNKTDEIVWTLKKDSHHTFYTNAEVEQHNNKKLNQLKGKMYESKANIKPSKGYKVKVNKEGVVDNTGFMKLLTLKKGARVMLIKNICTEDGLVNGAMGTVLGFIEDNVSSEMRAVIVQFDNPDIGKNLRRAKANLCSKFANENGTPIERIKLDYSPQGKSMFHEGVKVLLIQFPLRLAWASTAHKMQGITIKKDGHLVCHGHNRFPKGMGYVMLSRCSSIESIHLTETFDLDKYLICDSDSLKEKENLDNRSKWMQAYKEETFDIFYVNIQSLIGKKTELNIIKNDPTIMKSKCIAFAETWIPEGDESFELPGYNFHGASLERGKGCCIYDKKSENFKLLSKEVDQNFQILTVDMTSKNLLMTVVYLSSGCNLNAVVNSLRKVICSGRKHIILGDFNFDESEKNTLTKFLEKNKFKQLVKRPTHEQGRCLDHVYTNCKEFITEMKVQGVFYSDHACITLKLQT